MMARRRDIACGLVFATLGLGFGAGAWWTLPVGRAVSMGPGYFPVVLGIVLASLGVVIIVKAAAEAGSKLPPVAWTGISLIIGAVLAFGLCVRGAGLAPSLLVATFMAAMATRKMSVTGAAVLSVLLTVFNVGIFVFALRLPYPVIGPWLGG